MTGREDCFSAATIATIARRGLKRSRQDRIDIAVGSIERHLKGLPLDSLLLVRDMVNEAVKQAHHIAATAVHRGRRGCREARE